MGGFIYTAGVILVQGATRVRARVPHMAGVELFKFDSGVLLAIPIFVFGFQCHVNVSLVMGV